MPSSTPSPLGAIDEDGHFDLVDGVLFAQMTSSPEHSALVHAAMQLLMPEIDELRVQSSIGCGPRSLLEPDAVLTPSRGPHAWPEGARELRGGDVLDVPESEVVFSVDELFAVAERRG